MFNSWVRASLELVDVYPSVLMFIEWKVTLEGLEMCVYILTFFFPSLPPSLSLSLSRFLFLGKFCEGLKVQSVISCFLFISVFLFFSFLFFLMFSYLF